MQTSNTLNLEPTLPGAAWRYRWLVLVTVILFGALGWWYGTTTEASTATATIAVQDPRSSIVFDQVQRLDPARYVADQIEIAKSRAVAQRTLDNLAAGEPPTVIDIEDFQESLSVTAAEATDVISISYTHPDADTAVLVANAASDAYQAISREGAEATFSDALAELDEKIAERGSELDTVAAELAILQTESPEQLAVQEELLATVEAVLTFPEPLATATPEEIAAADAELLDLRQRVEILRAALAAFTQDEDAINDLLLQQEEVRSRLSALQLRRDQLAVDAELAGNGVVFSSPAETAEPSSGVLFLVLGVLGGAIIGAALAQSLARRRRSFHTRREPQSVLQAGLISDVPIFGDERLRTELPATEAPESAAAESFRFVATGISIRQHASDDTAPFKTVVVASATLADGKTTVTANTAFAAARGGSRVALIDADFANPALTTLLTPDDVSSPGLTDVVGGDADLDDIAEIVTGANGTSLTLFRRGTMAHNMPDFFGTNAAAQLINDIEESFDLVLIDAPPVLRLAHGSTVVRLGQQVLVVVAHKSDIATAEELQHYLAVVGVPVMGYVYNFAPLRREILGGGGSGANSSAA
ncbi:MAG: P-loop NTPase [Acidimicrobiia bacterium]|nr:P-loop NTPase [Acidimicrobiia bacterium]